LECQSDSDEPFLKTKRRQVETKKREQHLLVYVSIKRWPTGEIPEMDEEQMWFEVAQEENADHRTQKKLSIPSK
jgi:hypothetical protein